MTQVNLSPASGTRDFLPNTVYLREHIFAIIKTCFQQYGFDPIETPAFERIETLTGKYGDEGEKLIFKILKRGEKESSGEADMALRYDLTVPTLRFYLKHQNELPKIFKRYQIGPVWRADRPTKGRYREFYQCDIDIMGASGLHAEKEILSTLSQALKNIGLPHFTIKINSKKIIEFYLEHFGVAKADYGQVLIILDKMDKIGLEKVIEELKNVAGVTPAFIAALSDNFAETVFHLIPEHLKQDIILLQDYLATTKLVFDPFLARGLDYYTGIIFEIFSPHFPGAIGSGGRYDGLSLKFSNKDIPMVGGSLGIERIFLALEEQNLYPSLPHKPRIFVTVWDEHLRKSSENLLQTLRAEGMHADIDLSQQKLGQQIKFADTINADYCLIIGPEEAAQNMVAVKALKTGNQQVIKQQDIITHIINLS